MKKINSTSKHWLNLIAKVGLFLVLFSLLSSFLARHMLSTEQSAPILQLGPHLKTLSLVNRENSTLVEWKKSEQHLVYFFAPWCTVCALSQPSLSAFSSLKPNIKITMIALDWEKRSDVVAFKQDHDFKQLILLGDQNIKRQWQVDAYPSYYFVNNKGEITSKDRGLVTLPGLLARAL